MFVWKIFYYFELNCKERIFENVCIFIVCNEIEMILLNFNIVYGGEMILIKIYIVIIMCGFRIYFWGGGEGGLRDNCVFWGDGSGVEGLRYICNNKIMWI